MPAITEAFNEEFANLRSIFSRRDYTLNITVSLISNQFDSRNPSVGIAERNIY